MGRQAKRTRPEECLRESDSELRDYPSCLCEHMVTPELGGYMLTGFQLGARPFVMAAVKMAGLPPDTEVPLGFMLDTGSDLTVICASDLQEAINKKKRRKGIDIGSFIQGCEQAKIKTFCGPVRIRRCLASLTFANAVSEKPYDCEGEKRSYSTDLTVGISTDAEWSVLGCDVLKEFVCILMERRMDRTHSDWLVRLLTAEEYMKKPLTDSLCLRLWNGNPRLHRKDYTKLRTGS